MVVWSRHRLWFIVYLPAIMVFALSLWQCQVLSRIPYLERMSCSFAAVLSAVWLPSNCSQPDNKLVRKETNDMQDIIVKTLLIAALL